ncbi:MAG: RloB family protein [Microscillaceae bacterium]|jgi:hypothetical protein|nr:RloB family protein [Microscillaceae bacterium]
MRQKREFKRPSHQRELAKLFVIATEGSETEKQYFEALNSTNPRVHIKVLERLDTASSPSRVLKLLDDFKKEFKLRKGDELWLVIDRDYQSWKEKEISEVAQLCQQKGYFMALSNPCFELWLILHLEYLCNFSEEELHKLFDNQAVNKNKNFIDKVLEDLLSGYNKTNLKMEEFTPFIKLAIKQAKSLDINLKDRWQDDLGTRVYQLVEKLITL